MYLHPKVRYNDSDADTSTALLKHWGMRIFRNNKAVLAAVTGEAGSGKSWLTGSLSELYAKMWGVNYSCENHMVFGIKPFLKLAIEDNDKIIRRGSVINFDEPQLEANSRKWQSEANQILANVVSMMRYKGFLVLFPTPFIDFLDKQVRRHFQWEINVLGYDLKTRETTIKPRFLEWNKYKQKVNYKMLKVEQKKEDRATYNKWKVDKMTISSPSQSWIDYYEPKATKFKNEWLLKQLNQITKDENKQLERKNEDLMKFEELVSVHGYDIIEISKQMPNIAPYTLERWIQWQKKRVGGDMAIQSPLN